jgi:hypothetical protein
MAKNDFDNFDFEDESMFDFDASSSGGDKKKQTFFRDLASGIGIGALKKMGSYMPPVQETVESAGEMADQMRDQFQAVRTQATKIGTYAKGVSDDIKTVIGEIRSSKSLKDKVDALNKGITQTKKNLAYKIDPEAAESFDFDKMFGDNDDYSSSSEGSSTPSPGSTTPRSDDSFIREQDEMLGLTGPGSIGGIRPSGSGYGGTKGKSSGGNKIIVNAGGSQSDDKEGSALRETIIVSNARLVANQNRLFKQQYIIDTKRHLQKMHALRQVADVTTLTAKFNAEVLGPSVKQQLDYLAKFTAQFTDMIDLQRSDNPATGWNPIANAFGKRKNYSKKSMLDFTTSSGGINFGELYGHASKQAKDLGDMYGLDMVKDMGSSLAMMLVGGGGFNSVKQLGSSLGGLMMMPFKKQMTTISQQLSQNIAPTMMKAYEGMKESDNSMLNQIAEFLNIDTGTKEGVSLSTQNRRVSFDMVTRRSIVEVIPGFLGDILSAISGGDKKIFDHTTGQFTTEKALSKRITSEIDSAGLGSMYGSRNALNRAAKEKGTEIDSDALNTILKNVMLSGEMLSSKKLTNPEYVDKIMHGVTGDRDRIQSAFSKSWSGLGEKEKSNFHIETQRARDSRRRELTDRELNYLEYGSSVAVGATQNNARISELKRKRHDMQKFDPEGTMKGTKKYDEFTRENLKIDEEIARLQMASSMSGPTTTTGIGGAVQTAASKGPIQQIYDLLLQGIYVYPQGINKKPQHLKDLFKQKEDEKTRSEQLQAELEEHQRKYKELKQQADETKAELITDKLEEQKKTLFEKTIERLPKPIQDMISNSWVGKKAAEMKSKAKDNKIIKAMAGAKAKVSGALDATSDYINSVTSEGGFDIGKIGADAASVTKKAPGAVVAAASGLGKKVDEQLSGSPIGAQYEAAKKLTKQQADKFKQTDVYKKASALGMKAKDVLTMAQTAEGREKLGELVKSESDSLQTKLKTTIGDVGKTIQTKAGEVKEKVLDNKQVQKFLQTPVGKKAINVIGNAQEVAKLAQTKEGRDQIAKTIKEAASSAQTKLKTTIGDVGKTIQTKAGEVKEKVPDAIQRAKDAGLIHGKDANDAIAELTSGKLSAVGMFKVHMKLLGMKLNTALFGEKEDVNETKKGVIGKVLDVGKGLITGVVDFLIGQKDGKRYGMLYKVLSPAMTFFENFRHQFMSRIALPFKSIAQATGKSIKWLMRDVKSNISYMGKGLMEKFRSGLDWLKKRGKESTGEGGKKTILDRVFGLGSTLTGAATRIIGGKVEDGRVKGGIMGFAYSRADKKMQRMVAQGKISPEEYQEWQDEQAASQSSEEAKHQKNMSQLETYRNTIISKDMSAKLATGTDEISDLQAKAKNMTFAQMKEDRANAKKQEKINRNKLKRGETLTEEEQYAALTADKRAYRKQDDLLRAAEKEYKKQQEELEKKKFQMQEQQTENTGEIKDKVSDIRDIITGAKEKSEFKKNYVKEKQAEKAEEAKKSTIAEATTTAAIITPLASPPSVAKPVEPKFVDKSTGYTEGSFLDKREDAREAQQDEAFKMIRQTLPAIAAGTAATTAATERVDKNTDELEKYAKGGLKDKAENFLKGLKNTIMGALGVAGGTALMAAGSAPFAAAGKQAGNVIRRTKDDGVLGGLGEVTGLDSAGDSNFNYNGTRKNAVEGAADRFKSVRFGIRGGYKKAAGLVGRGGKMFVNGLSRLPGGKAVGNVAKNAGGKLLAAATKAIKFILNTRVIKRLIKPDQIAKIVKNVSTKFAKNGAVAAAKEGFKKVLGVLSGGIGIAIFAAADFASGMANAKRYFNIPPGAKIPMGMRIAAGVATALSGLAYGIIPEDWLARTVYDIVASKEDKEALKGMQDEQGKRAAELGVDPDRLNEIENRTWGQSFMDALPGGKKRKKKREARLLGMSEEEYDEWVKKKEALDKASAQNESEAVLDQHAGGVGKTVSGGTTEQDRTGIINGDTAARIPGMIPKDTAKTGFVDLNALEEMSKRGVAPLWIYEQAKEVAAGTRKDLDKDAKDWLMMNGLGTKVEADKDTATLARMSLGAIGPDLEQSVVAAMPGVKDKKDEKKKERKKLSEVIGNHIGKVGANYTKAFFAVTDGLAKIPNMMAKNVGKTIRFVTKTIPETFVKVKDTVGNFITQTIPKVFTDVKDAFGKFFTETLPKAFKDLIGNIGNFVTKVIPEAFGNLKDAVGNFITQTIPEIGKKIWSTVTSFVTEAIPNAIKGVFGKIGNFFGNIGKSTAESYTSEMKETKEARAKKPGFFASIGNSFKEGLGGADAPNPNEQGGTIDLNRDFPDMVRKRNKIEKELYRKNKWKKPKANKYGVARVDPAHTKIINAEFYKHRLYPPEILNKMDEIRRINAGEDVYASGDALAQINAYKADYAKHNGGRLPGEKIDPTKMADAFSDIFTSVLNTNISGLTKGAMGSGSNSGTSTGGSTYTTQSGAASFDQEELDKNVKDSSDAATYFAATASGGLNRFLENKLATGDYAFFKQLADKIEDPAHKGQLRNVESLSPEFKTRVKEFLADPRLAGKNVTIREAKRTPLTQLAYFTKGRSRNIPFIHEMFRKAGFQDGAWDPGLKNTWTIGSKHFSGNAIDIEDHNKGIEFYRSIAPIAKQHGLEWGGDWSRTPDYPHFEMPRSGRLPGVQTATATSNTAGENKMADAPNPNEPVNLTNVPAQDYLKHQTKQIDDALELQSIVKSLDTIHGDLTQVIGILKDTYNLHERNYSEESPMREYYNRRKNSTQNLTQSATGSAFGKYTGGESSDEGFSVDMSKAVM